MTSAARWKKDRIIRRDRGKRAGTSSVTRFLDQRVERRHSALLQRVSRGGIELGLRDVTLGDVHATDGRATRDLGGRSRRLRRHRRDRGTRWHRGGLGLLVIAPGEGQDGKDEGDRALHWCSYDTQGCRPRVGERLFGNQ